MDMSISDRVLVVVSVDPGFLFVNVLQSAKKFAKEKRFKVHFEYGTYMHKLSEPAEGEYWTRKTESIIFVGLTADFTANWADLFSVRYWPS